MSKTETNASAPMRLQGPDAEAEEDRPSDSRYDPLTGLAGPAFFQTELEYFLQDAKASGGRLAVIVFSLEQLERILETLEPNAGDVLLQEVARRLQSVSHREDLLARLEGDQFALVLRGVIHELSAAGASQKVVQAMQQPVVAGGEAMTFATSCGIALFPSDGDTPEILLGNARVAMDAARQGGEALRFYSGSLNCAAQEQLALQTDLHAALLANQLEVYYQPQVDLGRNGAVCGFEALARWKHPTRGNIPPKDFISLAENAPLIDAITDFVLRTACAQARQWLERYDGAIKLSVNLSARQFIGGNLIELIGTTLRESGLPAENLQIELTESSIMQDPSASATVLGALKSMGVSIAVDDFGTGCASLACLKRFPVDQIKIDNSFVADLPTNSEAASICASIIRLAHGLRLSVIAEGVETDGQLGFLLKQGCEYLQGFVFSEALPSSECEALLRTKRKLDLSMFAACGAERTLLLVDDEENILSALKRLLRRDGYTILATTDPDEAFALLAQHPVGVIVSDQRMPKMSGTELLSRVKTLYPATVRLVLSGYTELKAVTDSINQGEIYRFLTKPWDDDQLRLAIREAFQQQKMIEENIRLSRENEQARDKYAEANVRLEALLEDKRRLIRRYETLISVVQETLHQVPVPVIAIDDEGMIVYATGAAYAVLPSAVAGNRITQCFTAPWASSVCRPGSLPPQRMEMAGTRYRLVRRRLGTPNAASGWLLTLLPEIRTGGSGGQSSDE